MVFRDESRNCRRDVLSEGPTTYKKRMDMHGPRPLARFVAVTLVVSGHVLLVILFWASRSTMRTVPVDSHRPGALIFVELPPAPPWTPADDPPSERSASARSTDRRNDRPALVSEPGFAADTPVPLPPVDWRREAQHTARAMAPELLEELQRKCEEADPPGWIPPECRKRSYESDWEPEPKRVGMQGLLPYVRIGKRCIVGLGFFGCAIGKLPEPDGDLFDDMSDPNRPWSSVPDLPEALTGPEAANTP